MNIVFKRADLLLKKLDFLAFAGLWIWLAIFQVQENKDLAWEGFLKMLLLILPTQIPGLIFSWYKNKLQEKLGRGFIVYWILCFLIALPILTICCIFLIFNTADSFVFISAASASFLLELILIANNYYQKKVQYQKWIKRIRLENAVLISIILFSMVISAMAVSSMGNPAYDNKNQLLIGYEFVLPKFFRHFWSFLSFTFQFLIMYLCGYFLFFINSRFLVPKILKQKGLIIYLLSLLALVAILYPLMGQLLVILPINQTFGRDIFPLNPFSAENAFGAISIILISLPVVLALQWGRQNSHILALEREKSQTELDLLKQQLNPHFFFNTLNNLYALSLQKSDKTSESILQLSELMRYTIYKGQEEKVQLSQEIKYLEDYIELQQMRLHKSLNFSFEKYVEDEEVEIAPLLLIVLIENAFKHGIEKSEETASLNLTLSCTKKMLKFSCKNSVEHVETDEKHGIGLNNLQKRLALLYPNRHTLEISSNKGIFKVDLQLVLA